MSSIFSDFVTRYLSNRLLVQQPKVVSPRHCHQCHKGDRKLYCVEGDGKHKEYYCEPCLQKYGWDVDVKTLTPAYDPRTVQMVVEFASPAVAPVDA